jgi:hypothetical protein
VTGVACLALAIFASGYSSCAGTTGPLFAPLDITPREVLLRASLSARQPAIGLARLGSSGGGERYEASIDYGRSVDTGWLTAEISGRILTLRADPGGLKEGIHFATVAVEETRSGAAGSLTVEFTVLP